MLRKILLVAMLLPSVVFADATFNQSNLVWQSNLQFPQDLGDQYNSLLTFQNHFNGWSGAPSSGLTFNSQVQPWETIQLKYEWVPMAYPALADIDEEVQPDGSIAKVVYINNSEGIWSWTEAGNGSSPPYNLFMLLQRVTGLMIGIPASEDVNDVMHHEYYKTHTSANLAPYYATVAQYYPEMVNQLPVAMLDKAYYSLPVNYAKQFDASGSYDPEGMALTYLWQTSDQPGYQFDTTDDYYTHAFSVLGNHSVSLAVYDGQSYSSMTMANVFVYDPVVVLIPILGLLN